MIIGIDIHDADTFQQYAEGVMPLLTQLGTTVLAAVNDIECLRGNWTPGRLVVLKFPSLETARAFYNSLECAPYKAMRESGSDSDIMLVEGLVDEDLAQAAEDNGRFHYLLGFNDPMNSDWVEEYQAKVPPIAARHGLVVPCLGDKFEVLRGSFDRQSMILLQFPSEDAYRAFWSDPDYLPIKKLREDNTQSEHIAFASGYSAA
jgi:uncharacterized protein (DUF1330 family)